MVDQKPKTRWNRRYSRRFRAKYHATRQDQDKREIYRRTIDIANHLTPSSIGGCMTCPEGEGLKLEFNTGLVIVYKFKDPDITFLTFYYRQYLGHP